MKLDTALSMLRQQPLLFLSQNLLSIVGSNISGIIPYYFGYYDGVPIGVNEAFRFSPYAFDVDPKATGIDGINKKMIHVHSLHMDPNTADFDISNLTGYVLGAGGPDIMITGQLSACIIAVQQQAGQLVIAHVQPGAGRQTGATLRQTIKLMGRFNGHGRVTNVFGLGDYRPRAHFVGIRTAGAWHLYAQVVGSGVGPITSSVQIL